MKEIKFRYYDKKNKLMWNVGSIDFSNGFVQLRSDGNQSVNDCLHCGETVNCYSPFKTIELTDLLQFTGLTDKNGKEIYEGDKLEHSIDGYKQQSPYVVESVEQLYADINSGDSYYRVAEGSFKIIGNIYENPELLEAVK